MHEKTIVLLAIMFLSLQVLAEQDWQYKHAGENWTWLDDYTFLSATYLVSCEPGRYCEVGSGISIGGSPLGGTTKINGTAEVQVFGVGALKVRAIDGLGKVKVAFRIKTMRLVGWSSPW